MSKEEKPAGISLKDAIEYSYNNKSLLTEHPVCGCYHCGTVFSSSEVVEYIHEETGERGDTGVCPYCHVDSLLPGVDDPEVLQRLYDEAFSMPVVIEEEVPSETTSPA